MVTFWNRSSVCRLHCPRLDLWPGRPDKTFTFCDFPCCTTAHFIQDVKLDYMARGPYTLHCSAAVTRVKEDAVFTPAAAAARGALGTWLGTFRKWCSGPSHHAFRAGLVPRETGAGGSRVKRVRNAPRCHDGGGRQTSATASDCCLISQSGSHSCCVGEVCCACEVKQLCLSRCWWRVLLNFFEVRNTFRNRHFQPVGGCVIGIYSPLHEFGETSQSSSVQTIFFKVRLG